MRKLTFYSAIFAAISYNLHSMNEYYGDGSRMHLINNLKNQIQVLQNTNTELNNLIKKQEKQLIEKDARIKILEEQPTTISVMLHPTIN